jgi:hypothetical protein
LVEGGRSGAVFVGQVHAVMGHVVAVVADDMRPRHGADAEVFALHGSFSFTHTVALADRAAFSADFPAGRVT